MHRDGKPLGFFYLDHRTVDSLNNIITDTFVTPGNVNDVKPYLERLKYQIDKFGFSPFAVGLDAGYNTSPICKYLHDLGINAAMGTRRGCHQKGKYGKYKFVYLKEWDVYLCPERNYLEYATTDRNGYREYKANNKRCESCPRRNECLSEKQITHEEIGKRIYERRKETIERSFAESKELHGQRYCRMRGLAKVEEQCLLTAAVQNMKRIACILWKKDHPILTALFKIAKLFYDILKQQNPLKCGFCQ